MASRAWQEMAAAVGFVVRLRPFLRETTSVTEAHRRLERSLAGRANAFLAVVRRAILDHAGSPYRPLFQAAGIDAGAVERMVAQVGVEGALARLHDAGVFVTLEEFKGVRPIQRPGIEIQARAEDFDNPLSARDYEANTGGSGGNPRRILIGLDLLAHEADYHAGFYAAHGAEQWKAAMWLPAPPGAVGLKSVLIRARLGATVERWFAQNRGEHGGLRHRAFAGATRLTARTAGWRVPEPEYTPAPEARRVASWLAGQRAAGMGAILLTTPSAAVRTCGAAQAGGLDIAGTLFVLVGEPYTEAKAHVITSAGCTGAAHYAMVEAGLIGLGCRRGEAPDDVHLASDKVATIECPRRLDGNGASVNALFHTSLLGAAPKVMLNVESGDTGVIEERSCGCGELPASFRRHLHTIRSYEKLTSEGMHFLGTDLIRLMEEELVRRYGGRPTDWQLVEQEVDGLPRVTLVASPSIGDFDEGDARRTVLAYLRERGVGQRLMAEVWENGGTLAVVREEPFVTPGGKIQPLQRR